MIGIRLKKQLAILCAAVVAMSLSASLATAGTSAYKYDGLGRVVKVTYPDGKQVCYDYDKAGNRTKITKIAGTCTPATLLTAAVQETSAVSPTEETTTVVNLPDAVSSESSSEGVPDAGPTEQ